MRRRLELAALFLVFLVARPARAADPVWWSPSIVIAGDSYIYDTRLYWHTYFGIVNGESMKPATPGPDGDYTFGESGASYLDYTSTLLIASGYHEVCIFRFSQNDCLQDAATAAQYKTRMEAKITLHTVTNINCGIVLVDYPTSLIWVHPTYTGDPTRQAEYAQYRAVTDEVIAANPLVFAGADTETAAFAAFDTGCPGACSYHPNAAGDAWLVEQWALAIRRALDARAAATGSQWQVWTGTGW